MIKSDLVLEFSKKLINNKDYEKNIVKINKYITKTTFDIKTNAIMQKVNREKGYYICFDFPYEQTLLCLESENMIKQVKEGVKTLIKKCGIEKLKSALVVGLGNNKMVADSFGSKVIENILVTRHAIVSNSKLKDELTSVSAFSCSVFGKTGFESINLIKGVVEDIKPDIVIILDTLVANSYKRLCTNIQMANVGIVPGSGVDNNRKEISQQTLNVPVITIGIPFVVYSNNLVSSEIVSQLKQLSDKRIALKQNNNFLNNLVVMPTEIDQKINSLSKIIANGINNALNEGITKQDFETFFL